MDSKAELVGIFSSKKTRVSIAKDLDLKVLLGIAFADSQLAMLAAAPTGSTVNAYWQEKWPKDSPNDEEKAPAGVVLEVLNSEYIASKNQLILYQEGKQKELCLYVKFIDMRPLPTLKGIGGAIIWSIVEAVRKLGLPIKRIRLFGAGGRLDSSTAPSGKRWLGFVAWPRYGFDMKLTGSNKKILTNFPHYPSSLANCNSVTDMLELDGGADFWKYAGTGNEMEFLIDSDSRSNRILNNWYYGGGHEMTTENKGKQQNWGAAGTAKFVVGNAPVVNTPRRRAGTAAAYYPNDNPMSAKRAEKLATRGRESRAEIPVELLD